MQRQKQQIEERIKKFDGKLYLEFGGKLFDDFHEQHFISIFNDHQTIALQGMSKKIPKIVRFLITD
ncbi:MAG: DUF1846 family protein, partial [Oscillospiraceae bacterium]